MELKELKLTSKKTGKPFTAYCFQVGDYQSPIFFPSKIELDYIQQHLSSEFDDDGTIR